MTEQHITIRTFDELPKDDESTWEEFDKLTDEEADAVDDPDNPPLTHEQLKQFRRTYYVRGEKIWEDEKTIGEWLEQQGEVPTLINVDSDIAAWFKARGGDAQAMMNSVLREYVQTHQSTTP